MSFSLKLKRDGSYIIYDAKAFIGNPISISVPDIVKILEFFIKDFEEVGIVDEFLTKPTSSKRKEEDKDNTLEKNFQKLTVVNAQSLKGLSGKAYICKARELDHIVLEQCSAKLTQYIQDTCSKLSSDNLLNQESNFLFSGLSEVFELRNYLTRYTKSRNKIYLNGYIYVMPV